MFSILRIPTITGLLLILLGLPSISRADATWNGSTSQDWNTTANWSTTPSGWLGINMAAGNYPILNATPTVIPNDVSVGYSSGSGRFDHRSGALAQAVIGSSGNWFFVGVSGGTGTYNLADTSTSGGGISGFAQGSGSLTVGKLWVAGAPWQDNGVGTVNINTTSGLDAQSTTGDAPSISVANWWTTTGTINLENGTVSASKEIWVGNVGTGTINQSGGTLSSASWFVLSRYNGANGTYNLTGGTVNAATAGGNVVLTSEGGTSALNVSGGNFNVSNGDIWVCENYDGAGADSATLNISGTGNVWARWWVWLTRWNSGTSAQGTVNLNGGTLETEHIEAGTGVAKVNFNGGTLKARAGGDFMGGTMTVSVLDGGAVVDSFGNNLTISKPLVAGGTGVGGLTKTGNGTLTLSGACTYTGNTIIKMGTLALGAGGSLGSSPSITVSNGATFDVSAISYTLAAGRTLKGNGAITGGVTMASGASIAPGASAGALTFNHNLTLNAGSTNMFELGSSAGGVNNKVLVGGTLTCNGSKIYINATDGSLDQTTDYVLFNVTGGTSGSMASSPEFVGVLSPNAANFIIVTSGNNVVLRYSPAAPPTLDASANMASATRNQAVTITAVVTNGSSTVASVKANVSDIGGSASADLVFSHNISVGVNAYTNSFVVTASTTVGNGKSIVVTATDNTTPTPLTGNDATLLDIVAANQVWDGGASPDAKWSSNPNWLSDTAPGLSGDSVSFAGSANTSPDMDNNYSVSGVAFNVGAGSFTIGSASSTLTSGSGGIVNNSTSPQILNVPVVMGAAQTISAASGDITLGSTLNAGSTTLTVDGAANTTLSGAVSGAASLTKNGNGTLSLAGAGNSLGSTMRVNAGTVSITGGTDNVGNVHIANAASGTVTGTLNIAATLNSDGETVVFDGQAGGVSGTGTLNVNSGTLNSEGDLLLAFAGSGTGNVNIAAGATVNVASTTKRWLILNYWDTTKANLTLNGGTVNLNAGTDIQFSVGWYGPGASVGQSSVTLNSGAINGGATSVLNLNNNGDGAVDNSLNLNGGTLSISQILSSKANGSRVVNFNGGTLKPTANNASFLQGLSAANVQSGGAIIDTDGKDIAIAQPLLAGSPSGGLTKNGNGTLTLNGLNTYTGTTVVNAGTLAGTGTLAGPVSVASGATLAPGTSVGTMTINSTLTLDAGSTTAMELQKVSGTPGSDLVAGLTGLTAGGTLNVTLASGSEVLAGGESFTLFNVTPSGSFAAVSLPSLSAGLNWWTGNNYGAITVNRAPVGSPAFTRANGVSMKISKSALMAGVSDPDNGDSATYGALASTGSQGATVTEDASFIYYLPANNNNDTLTFSVADTRGGTATLSLNITVVASAGVAQGVAISGGTAILNCAGIPGFAYVIERSTNLVDWGVAPNSATNAPAAGLWQYLDTFSDLGYVPSSAYYRTAQP